MQEPARDTPVIAETDVVVLGAGPAGIAAAVGAARNGAKVMLVERYGFLGGGGTIIGASSFDGLHANVHGEIKQVVHGVVDEVLERIDRLDGLNQPHLVQGRIYAQSYDVSAWKLASDEIVLGAGVTLQLHTLAVGAVAADGRIDALLVETRSGRGAIRARAFVDCSGDAMLSMWCGVPCALGDEEGHLQPAAMLFRLAGVDDAVAAASVPGVPALMEEANRTGAYDLPRIGNVLRPLKHPGEWRTNLTKVLRPDGSAVDGTRSDDLIFCEIEGRRQVRQYWEFLRAKVAGFEKSYVVDVGPEIGIRESRRVAGQYTLTVDDIESSRSFSDGIGVNGWPVERHTAAGIEWRFPVGRGYHQIPFRCLVPEGPGNLLVAGRCISAASDAQAAIRVSGPCFVTGQAAGTAAALALSRVVAPGAVAADVLQPALLAEGVFLE